MGLLYLAFNIVSNESDIADCKMTGHWPNNQDSIPDSDKDLFFTVTFQAALEPTSLL
jgi:hypothetical protein